MINILSTIKLPEPSIEELKKQQSEVNYRFVHSKDMTKEDYEWATVLNTYGSHINHHDITAFKNLKWLNVMSAGVDSLPFDKLGDIPVTNARGIHKIPMMEYTIGLILNYYKNFYHNQVDQNNRFWNKEVSTKELYGRNVHIFGTGSIGAHIATVLQAFGVKTTGYNTNGRAVDGFSETYPMSEKNSHVGDADIVISILPKTDETNEIFDQSFFDSMDEDAVFINIGRGNVVSDAVLEYTLDNNVIKHMILDVFNTEPLPEDSRFYDYQNLTVSPHSSATTDVYYERASEILIRNLALFPSFEKMENVVDGERGY